MSTRGREGHLEKVLKRLEWSGYIYGPGPMGSGLGESYAVCPSCKGLAPSVRKGMDTYYTRGHEKKCQLRKALEA